LADGIEGPFQLEIDYIALVYDENHKEETAYEMYQAPNSAHPILSYVHLQTILFFAMFTYKPSYSFLCSLTNHPILSYVHLQAIRKNRMVCK
jgi:hypothetical protein